MASQVSPIPDFGGGVMECRELELELLMLAAGVPTERPAEGVPTKRPAAGVPTERPAVGDDDAFTVKDTWPSWGKSVDGRC